MEGWSSVVESRESLVWAKSSVWTGRGISSGRSNLCHCPPSSSGCPPIPVILPCQVDIVNSASISSVTITEQSWKSNLPNTFLDVGSFNKLPSA